ncbi:hypothetical protein ACWD5V_09260 [Streptomyces sp. NPDC002523]
MTTETAPKNTANKRTRRALRDNLWRITGRNIAEVRITRVRWDDGLRWCALALTVDPQPPFGHREVPLPDGSQHREIALLLRDAFPHANWARAQDYDVETGALREHVTPMPECLRGDEQ